MRKKFTIICFIFLCPVLCAAQNVGINATGAAPNASAMLDVAANNKGLLLPRVSLTGTGDITTIPSPAASLLVYNTAYAGTSPNAVIPGYYYWTGAKWTPIDAPAPSTIAFSTGAVINGATMVSAAPILMGLGNHAVETINGAGESTMPPQLGGYSFSVPFSGTIQNLQVSADILVASVNLINVFGIRYEFTVFVSHSTNNGFGVVSQAYVTTALSTQVIFGSPFAVSAGNFYSASAPNSNSIAVLAGDRVGIRIRTISFTDPAASDVSQVSFNASLSYTPAQ